MLKELIKDLLEFIVDPSLNVGNYRTSTLDTWRDAKEYKLDYVALIYEALEGENIHEYLYVENEFDTLAEIRLRSDLKRKVKEKAIPKNKALLVDYNDIPETDYSYGGQDGPCDKRVWTAYWERIEGLLEKAIEQVKKETEDTTVEKRRAWRCHPDGSIRFDNLEVEKEEPKKVKTYINRSEYVIKEIINKRK